jgi:hypothetical protein
MFKVVKKRTYAAEIVLWVVYLTVFVVVARELI